MSSSTSTRRYGLVPVHCDVLDGFIFVNFADRPRTDAARLSRPRDPRPPRAPVPQHDPALRTFGRRSRPAGSSSPTPSEEFYDAHVVHANHRQRPLRARLSAGFQAPHYPPRGSAPAGDHGRCAPPGRWPPSSQADPGHLPAAVCSARGTIPISVSCRWACNPAKCEPWGLDSFQSVPQLRHPVLGSGLVSDLLHLLADVVQHPHVRVHVVLPAATHAAGTALGQELAAATFKEYGLQDAQHPGGDPDPASNPVRWNEFLYCDQEILLRHLHKETASWIDAYQRWRVSNAFFSFCYQWNSLTWNSSPDWCLATEAQRYSKRLGQHHG